MKITDEMVEAFCTEWFASWRAMGPDMQAGMREQSKPALEAALSAALPVECAWLAAGRFAFGDRVRKPSGSWWEGKVVGYYSTKQTPLGYCVQYDAVLNGPVQIYPEAALEPAPIWEEDDYLPALTVNPDGEWPLIDERTRVVMPVPDNASVTDSSGCVFADLGVQKPAAPPVEYAGLVERLRMGAAVCRALNEPQQAACVTEAADAITALEARARDAEARIRELEAAVLAEREACAKIAEDDVPQGVKWGPGKGIADLIRARTQADAPAQPTTEKTDLGVPKPAAVVEALGPIEHAELIDRLWASGNATADGLYDEAADAITALEARAREAEKAKAEISTERNRVQDLYFAAEARARKLEAALRPLLDACIEDNGDPLECPGDDGPVGAYKAADGTIRPMAMSFALMTAARDALRARTQADAPAHTTEKTDD